MDHALFTAMTLTRQSVHPAARGGVRKGLYGDRIMIILRDIYKHPAVHVNHGVRCVDCGGRVLDTPAYAKATAGKPPPVQWRCAACRRALERPLPAPLEPMALRAGHSPIVNAAVAHLEAFGPSTTTDLVHATHTERKALVKSLEASTRVGYEHKSKTWRLKAK